MHADPFAPGHVIAAQTKEIVDLPRLLCAIEVAGTMAGAWERVQYDSRAVQPGDLFVAVKGLKSDGHAHVDDARRRGAVAAVVETRVAGVSIPQVRVAMSRRALALLAAEETGHPSRELVLVGVTGTNGKTTTAQLLRAVLTARGDRAGAIGTLGHSFESDEIPASHTTPEAPELARLLRRWRDRGATAVAMEVSSHALSQERTYGVAFDAGVFTNLTQDHLDYHGTLDAYREAKSRFFRAEFRGDRSKTFSAVVNMDDAAGRWIRTRDDSPFLGFGMGESAEVRAEDVRLDSGGTRFRVRTTQGMTSVALRLRGAFNVMNALAAFAGGVALGVPTAAIAAGIESVRSVPGRLEPVEEGQPFQVLVDYAHTPDALDRALEAVRALAQHRLLCVFGCGGDRDRGKRPLMGGTAARRADAVYLTSDNPRSENPMVILEEIMAGTGNSPNVRSIVDRSEAIEVAIADCREGDALLIAGKGHERTQILGERTIPFDDRDVARRALRSRGFGR